MKKDKHHNSLISVNGMLYVIKENRIEVLRADKYITKEGNVKNKLTINN